MTRVTGRDIYVVELAKVAKAADGRKSSQKLETNLKSVGFAASKARLVKVGVELWGWQFLNARPSRAPARRLSL